jgi:effector-binding domain-containing protein
MPDIKVQVKQTEPRMVAFISCRGSYDQMAEVFPRLFLWIQEKGYITAGPPSGVYYNNPREVPPQELLWEVRCPIGGKVSPHPPDEQGVGVKQVEPLEVAATIHRGPYPEVGATYQALGDWIAANGYEVTGPPEEVYLTPPTAVSPEDLFTEVRLPVRRR